MFFHIKLPTMFSQTNLPTMFSQTNLPTMFSQTNLLTMFSQTNLRTMFSQTNLLTTSSLFFSFLLVFYIFVVKINVVCVDHKLMGCTQFQPFQIFSV